MAYMTYTFTNSSLAFQESKLKLPGLDHANHHSSIGSAGLLADYRWCGTS